MSSCYGRSDWSIWIQTWVQAELAPFCDVVHVGQPDGVAGHASESGDDPANDEHDQVQRQVTTVIKRR